MKQQLSGLNAALEAFAGVYRTNNGTKPRRKLSAKGRASIAAAQRMRWARVKRQQKVVPIAKQNRGGSTSEVGEGQAGEESFLANLSV